MPETTPVTDPIVATLVLRLVQTPPVKVLLSVVVRPEQTVRVPVIAGGLVLTETIALATQLVPIV
jgi:hypothetical protein